MIRRILLISLAAAMSASLMSCAGMEKKKRKRDSVKLDGETGSAMPWNRPTNANQQGSPMGLPTSH